MCEGGKRDEKDCHCLGLHHNSWDRICRVGVGACRGLVIYCPGMAVVMGVLVWAGHLDHRREIRRQP
jgi:hypothetical protein